MNVIFFYLLVGCLLSLWMIYFQPIVIVRTVSEILIASIVLTFGWGILLVAAVGLGAWRACDKEFFRSQRDR